MRASAPLPVWRRFRWRAAFLLFTVALGLAGFLSGVSVTQRPEVVDSDLPTKVYYTLGLFIFGGMDLGTPTGGPVYGRVMLWTAYFAAPAITASALIETVLRLFGDDPLLLRRRANHIIVAGTGRLTVLYLERLRARDPDASVVVIAANHDAALDDLREQYRVQVVVADATSDAVLRRLRVGRAARVFLLSDDDFSNLDAAERVLALAPDVAPRTVVHVSDLRFLTSLATTRLARTCHMFNGHQIAASHLVHAHMLDHFRHTEPTDTVVLAGFGRFGQTVLDELQRAAAGAFDHVVIVDLEARAGCGVFEEQVGFSGEYRKDVIVGDIRDPSVWQEVEGHIDRGGIEPVIVVGSGNDRTNLRIALRLASRPGNALIVARSDRQRSFVEAFSTELGIRTFSVAQLVAQSMPRSWFQADAAQPLTFPELERTRTAKTP